MQLNTSKQASVSGLTSDATFSANMDGTGFSILISKLYSDKPRAVVRETIANCEDAHRWRDQLFGTITAGKIADDDLSVSERELLAKLRAQGYADPGTQYHIHLPTDLEPWLTFEDFGIGMTLDDAIGEVDDIESRKVGHPVRRGGYLNTLFNSSKRNENTSIGGFGLGCKCPLSIVDTFSYRVIHNGYEHQFIIYFSDGGVPDVNWLTRDEQYNPKPIKTDRKNGVIVRLDAVPADMYRYISTCAGDILQTLPEEHAPIINDGVKSFRPMTKEYIVDGVYFVNDFHYGTMFNNSYLVECGGVVYPLDETRLNDESMFDVAAKKFIDRVAAGRAVVLEMALGSVSIPPSREEISLDNEVTISNINTAIQRVNAKIQTEIEEYRSQVSFNSKVEILQAYKKLNYYFHSKNNTVALLNEIWEERKDEPQYRDIRVKIKVKQERYTENSVDIEILRQTPQFTLNEVKLLDHWHIKEGVQFKKTGYSLFRSEADFWGTPKKEDRFIHPHYSVVSKYEAELNGKLLLVDNNVEGTKVIPNMLNRLRRSLKEAKHIDSEGELKQLMIDTMGSVGASWYQLTRSETKVFSIDTFPDAALKRIHDSWANWKKAEFNSAASATSVDSAGVLRVSAIDDVIEARESGELSVDCDDAVYKFTEFFHGEGAVAPNMDDLEELNKVLRAFIRKNKPAVPKESEICRNVKKLDFQYCNFPRDAFCTMGLSSGNSVQRALDGDSPVYWTTYDSYEKCRAECKVKILDHRYIENYVEKVLGVVYIVKGKKTESRRSFDKNPNCIEINLEDLIHDHNNDVMERLQNGSHSVYKIMPYGLVWRFGYADCLAAMLLCSACVIPDDLAQRLRDLQRQAEENPHFAKLLELEDIDLENAVQFVRGCGVIDREYQRMSLEFDPIGRRTIQGECVGWRHTNSLRDCHASDKLKEKLTTRRRVANLDNTVNMGNTLWNWYDYGNFELYEVIDLFYGVMGVRLWESDKKALTDVLRIVDSTHSLRFEDMELQAPKVVAEHIVNRDLRVAIPDLKRQRSALAKTVLKEFKETEGCSEFFVESVKQIVERELNSITKSVRATAKQQFEYRWTLFDDTPKLTLSDKVHAFRLGGCESSKHIRQDIFKTYENSKAIVIGDNDTSVVSDSSGSTRPNTK